MIGNITVTYKGEFIRSYKNGAGSIYKKEPMYSPIVQNEKHINIIKVIMAGKINQINKMDVAHLLMQRPLNSKFIVLLNVLPGFPAPVKWTGFYPFPL